MKMEKRSKIGRDMYMLGADLYSRFIPGFGKKTGVNSDWYNSLMWEG